MEKCSELYFTTGEFAKILGVKKQIDTFAAIKM